MTIIIVSCQKKEKEYVEMPQITASEACGAGCDTIIFKPNNPKDVKILNQQCANTFAWQSFIAMTWPSSPTKAGQPDRSKGIEYWGKPGDLTPMTFGTYKSVEDVFTTQVPKPWGSNLEKIMDTVSTDGKSARSFSDFNKFDDDTDDDDVISELFQASGKTAWLTDQNGNLIWYEIKLDETEFNFITKDSLYIPKKQEQVAKNGGIWMPNGSIEIKASWRIVPREDLQKVKKRYKLITALVPKSVEIVDGKIIISKETKEEILGLVGLHIIQKTPSMPQFHWATFEHVDLAPDTNIKESDIDWLLYNPEKYDEKANVSPNPKKNQLDTPIQTIKETIALHGKDAKVLNAYMKQQIVTKNPESVFQYYELVDTQWPSSAVADADNNTHTPLKFGGQTPMVLTNVSMETYVQGMSCLGCHVNAGIKHEKGFAEYASDYSFVFGMAKPAADSLLTSK